MKICRVYPAIIISASFMAPLAHAQVEEITITAQRREASLQEVPISVSAFSEDDMEKLQINAVSDIAAAVPNMQTFDVTANAAAMQVFMRGAGIQNPGFNASESPVGYYIDDVYRGRMATANLDMTDIGRTEVLRGPQGTLYGRNTIAGAVKFITRTPGDDFWGNASVGYGNYETSKLTASAGGPLVDGKLAGSVALLYHNRDEGWIDRGSVGGRDLGEYTNQAFRGKLHWYEGDIFDAEFSIAYVDVENDGYNGIPYNGNSGQPVEGFYDTLVTDANAGFGESDQLNSSLHLSWDLGSVVIESITGYSDIDDDFGFDLTAGVDQGSGTPFYITSDSTNKTISQEIKFSGDAFENTVPFHWIAGLYFMNEDGDQTYNPGFVSEVMDTNTDSYAIYGEGTWDITEKFGLTLGGRVTRDEKDYKIDCLAGCSDGPAFPPNPVAPWSLDMDDTFTEFTPRILLEYQVVENTMLWASVSRGYQAGGYQALCLGNVDCASNVYDPETVTSSELGVKSDFLDNTIRINAATWYAQYSDIQQTIITGGNFPLVNAGDVDVLGLDIEAYWSPNEQFNAFAILGFATEDFSSDSAVSADRLPGMPESTARVGANWSTPLRFAPSWNLVMGADIEHSDDYLSALAQTPVDELTVSSFTRWNGFIGAEQPDGHWSVILSGTNVGDSEDIYSGIVASFFTNIRTVQPPREFMLTAKYRY